LAQKPSDATLLSARMHVFFKLKQMDKAEHDAQRLVEAEPQNETARFYLAYARSENPGNQPDKVISTLFDDYADRFDKHLVVGLQYRLPKDVAEMIHQWHPDRKGDVLDLGCGTGLLGVCLGRLEGVLVGVDLSNEMIEKAAQHNVYDKFHLVDVVAAVRATPANQYHVVAALEVFVYIGDLQEVVPNTLKILMPGGRFVFSCEAAQEGEKDFNLQETFRYTHQPLYLKRLMDEAGFEDVTIEERSVRMHAGQPVSGLLVTGRKPVSV
jgi:predicted TPR repeat methyltransferase